MTSTPRRLSAHDTARYTKGTRVAITETEHEKLAQPEVATVFEDYGQSHVNVMRSNGQLHAVPRSSMALA